MNTLTKLNQALLQNAQEQQSVVSAWGDTPTEKQRGEYEALVKKYSEIEKSIETEKGKQASRAESDKIKAAVNANLDKIREDLAASEDASFVPPGGDGTYTQRGDAGSIRPVTYRERYKRDEDFSHVMWKHGARALFRNEARDAEIFYTEGGQGSEDKRIIQRAVSTTAQGGGVMIPHQILQLMRRAVTPNVLRRICTVVDTGTNNTIPVESTFVELPPIAEGAPMPEKTNAIVLDNEIQHGKWGAFYSITQEAIDENYNLESLVMNYATKSLNVQELRAHLTTLLAQVGAGLTKAGPSIDFPELVSLRTKIPEEDHELATYILSPELRSEIISMVDDNGLPFFPREVFIAGIKELHGRTVTSSSFFPSGSDAKIGLVGNFNRVVIGDPPNPIHITIDRYTRAKEQKVEIIFAQRGGIKLVDANAVKAVVNPS